jgi:hypothetical protein
MKTWLFNPFKFIAGNKALMLGIGAMLFTAIACLLEKMHLDGLIDAHEGRETAWYFYFIEPIIDWLCLVLPLYIFGRLLSASSIRFVDVAGTSALARYPMFFVVLLSLLAPKDMSDPQKFIATIQANPALEARLIGIALLVLPFAVWTVALMYNAYSTSVNLKGPKAAWSFIASFIIAEVLSKVIIVSMI